MDAERTSSCPTASAQFQNIGKSTTQKQSASTPRSCRRASRTAKRSRHLEVGDEQQQVSVFLELPDRYGCHLGSWRSIDLNADDPRTPCAVVGHRRRASLLACRRSRRRPVRRRRTSSRSGDVDRQVEPHRRAFIGTAMSAVERQFDFPRRSRSHLGSMKPSIALRDVPPTASSDRSA